LGIPAFDYSVAIFLSKNIEGSDETQLQRTTMEGLMDCCFAENEYRERPARRGVLAVDHMTSTPLFDAIQLCDWEGVDFFITTGTFSLSPFQDQEEHAGATVEDQAETWVVCRDEGHGKIKWRQLPIHAAICFGAPYATLLKLFRVYPEALACGDNDGNLPLHLAVKFNRSNEILLLILKAFPDALQARNGSGQGPLECADTDKDEAVRARFQVLQCYIDVTESIAEKNMDEKRRELRALRRSIAEAEDHKKFATKELNSAKANKRSPLRLFDRMNYSNKTREDSGVEEVPAVVAEITY
jgi:hypothetical protein